MMSLLLSPVVEDHNIDSGSSAAGENIVETPSVRLKRQAAAVCKQSMQKWCTQLKQ